MAAKLQCEICGGMLIGRPGGVFECDSCGMRYDTEWAKAKIQEITGTVKVEGTVQVQGSVKIENPVTIDQSSSIDNLLRLGESSLRDQRWDRALEYFERVLEIDAKNAEALLGRSMARSKQPSRACFQEEYCKLRSKPYGLSLMGNDIAACRELATGELKAWFERLDEIAEKKAREEKAEAARKKAEEAEKQRRQAEKLNRFAKYRESLQSALQGDQTALKNAAVFFGRDPNYYHSREAERLCLQKLAGADKVKALNDQRSECEKKKDEHQRLLSRSKLELSGLGLFGNRDRKAALRELISREEAACEEQETTLRRLASELSQLPDMDAIDRDLRALLLHVQLGELKPKSRIELGAYPMDASGKKAPIGWTLCTRTLRDKETVVTLISEQILDCAPKDSASGEWAASTLRSWLQNSFKGEAFTKTEQAVISELRLLKNEDESWFPSHPTGMTTFSIETAVTPTQYAIKRGTTCSRSNFGNRLGHGEWIQLAALPGYSRYAFEFRGPDGKTTLKSNLEGLPGVRPVIEITFVEKQ